MWLLAGSAVSVQQTLHFATGVLRQPFIRRKEKHCYVAATQYAELHRPPHKSIFPSHEGCLRKGSACCLHFILKLVQAIELRQFKGAPDVHGHPLFEPSATSSVPLEGQQMISPGDIACGSFLEVAIKSLVPTPIHARYVEEAGVRHTYSI